MVGLVGSVGFWHLDSARAGFPMVDLREVGFLELDFLGVGFLEEELWMTIPNRLVHLLIGFVARDQTTVDEAGSAACAALLLPHTVFSQI